MHQEKFAVNEKVRVSDRHFDPEMHGLVGRIAIPPLEVTRKGNWTGFYRVDRCENCDAIVYWVEFDQSEAEDSLDGSEIEGGFLTLENDN